ncbi:MAG: apolipoprotein N-acyltransferase, partial [Nocardiopsaceae bacterium]|nr:apolipoprotein N-acyltransferase [Nocardiopsaceae bacterium]
MANTRRAMSIQKSTEPAVPRSPAREVHRRGRGRGLLRALSRPERYASLLAGALPVLAFPSLNLEFFAWFGLVPGLLLFRAAPTGREAAVRGWWLGIGYLLMAMYWLTPNLGPALLLVAIVLGAPWSGVGYAAWRLLRRPEPAPDLDGLRSWHQPRWLGPPGPSVRQALAAMVVLPSCWVVIDWIRSWQAIGGPWAVFGASQWEHPVVLALAATGGIWLITFVVVAANTAIVIALTAMRLPGRAVGVACALLAIAAGPVAFALTADEYRVPPTGHVTLALVQPGLASGGPRALLNREIRLSTGGPKADLVVWGESSVGFDLDSAHRVMHEIQRLSAAIGTQVLVSQDAVSPAGAKSKVAVLIGPAGIEQSYTKTRLVPFGEYIPLRSVLGWLTSISRAAPQNMVTGHGAKVLHASLPDGRRLKFGVLICFESSFPDMSAVDANRGAQLLIFQTSDSTFQGSWAPEQHASLAALRAAETGRPAVQAALTGDSVAFDARGRLLAWASTADRGVVRVRLALPPASVRTPFDRFGDYVPWFAIA